MAQNQWARLRLIDSRQHARVCRSNLWNIIYFSDRFYHFQCNFFQQSQRIEPDIAKFLLLTDWLAGKMSEVYAPGLLASAIQIWLAWTHSKRIVGAADTSVYVL